MGLCRAVPRDRSQAWGPWTSELSRLVATSYEGNAWEGVAPPSLGCERGPIRWPVREAPTPASLTPVRRVLPGPPLPTGPPESRGGVGSAHTQGDPRGDGELWRPPGGEGAGGLPPQGRPLWRGCPRPRACRPPSLAVRRPIPPRCPGQGLCRVSERASPRAPCLLGRGGVLMVCSTDEVTEAGGLGYRIRADILQEAFIKPLLCVLDFAAAPLGWRVVHTTQGVRKALPRGSEGELAGPGGAPGGLGCPQHHCSTLGVPVDWKGRDGGLRATSSHQARPGPNPQGRQRRPGQAGWVHGQRCSEARLTRTVR